MNFNKIIILLLYIGLIANFVRGQGYEIEITVNGLKDTAVILGHYLNTSMYPDDTAKLDHLGRGIFSGDKKLPEGLYLIYLPSTSYFEIIMGSDQQFSIYSDTSNFIKSLAFKGSDENQIFLDFQLYMINLRKQADSLSSLLSKETDPRTREKFTNDLTRINRERNSAIERLSKEHAGTFVADFLKATLEVQVPDPPRDANGRIIDSTWQYYYYRKHYFDNFDFSDARLLRTPIYEDKIITYITKVIPQIPDTLVPEVDFLIDKSKSDSTLFRYMLITLFNYFGKSNIMGMDAVQIHIAEKYYLKDSWWSAPDFLAELQERVDKTKPLLIGKVAPDIELMSVPADHFTQASVDTTLKRYPHVGSQIHLYDVKARFLVLVFWEADCSHCKTAIPELYDIYESSLKRSGVQIMAVSTLFGEDGKIKWVDFVNENKLYDWINAWNPYSYDFKLIYDITSTPQIFLLDENKKIIAKKISPAQVEEIINSLSNT